MHVFICPHSLHEPGLGPWVGGSVSWVGQASGLGGFKDGPDWAGGWVGGSGVGMQIWRAGRFYTYILVHNEALFPMDM